MNKLMTVLLSDVAKGAIFPPTHNSIELYLLYRPLNVRTAENMNNYSSLDMICTVHVGGNVVK